MMAEHDADRPLRAQVGGTSRQGARMRTSRGDHQDEGGESRVARWLVWAVAGVYVAAQLAMAAQPLSWQLRHHIPDDAFYYFALGQSLATDGRLSFDGRHAASGFHPLWMAIVAVVFRLQPDPQAAVQTLIALCAVLATAAGLILTATLRRFFSGSAALVGGVIYFLNIPWFLESLNGLESALAMLLLVLVVRSLSSLLHSQPADHRRMAGLTLGLTLGLTAITRTDLAVFIPLVVGVGLVCRRVQWRQWLAAGAIGLTPLVGWLIVARLVLGHSGQASAYVLPMVMWSHYEPITLTGAVEAMLGALSTTLSGYVLPYFGIWLLVVAHLLAVAWSVWRRALPRYLPVLTVLWLALAVLVVIHGGLRLYPRTWYFLMAPIIGAFAAAGLRALALPTPRLQLWRNAFLLGTILAYGLIQAPVPLADRYPWQASFFGAAAWINDHEGASTGAFNSGIMGFYAPRRVVNLDGLVNESVIPALRERRLYQYLTNQGIDYVVDLGFVVEGDYARFWGVEPAAHLVPQSVIPGPTYLGFPVKVYRVGTASRRDGPAFVLRAPDQGTRGQAE